MSENRLLNIFQITEELNTGKATTKFILRRFSHLIPCVESDGQVMYPAESLKIVSILFERFHSGDLPSEIEQQPDLDGFSSTKALDIPVDKTHHHKKNNASPTLTTVVDKISSQQEEIKACLEKQSDILSHISTIINRISLSSKEKSFDLNEPQITVSDPLSSNSVTDDMLDDLSMLAEDDKEPENGITQFPEDEPDHTEQTDIDDLSLLLDDQTADSSPDAPLDDLWALVEADNPNSVGQKNNTSAPSELETPDKPDDLDNLSLLLDEPVDIKKDSPPKDMDDLSLLVDDDDAQSENGIETAHGLEPAVEDIDDLSALIDQEDSKSGDSSDIPETDDLPAEIDNLFDLVDHEPVEEIQDSNNDHQIIIDADPDDVETYKAAIMETILRLKEEGKSVDEAVMMLNQNQVQTLSGKSEWSEKAISQIYTFIDSAA